MRGEPNSYFNLSIVLDILKYIFSRISNRVFFLNIFLTVLDLKKYIFLDGTIILDLKTKHKDQLQWFFKEKYFFNNRRIF